MNAPKLCIFVSNRIQTYLFAWWFTEQYIEHDILGDISEIMRLCMMIDVCITIYTFICYQTIDKH